LEEKAMFNPEGLVGKVLDGKYRLAEFLGEGSFGWVYSADLYVDGRARSQCAIKVMRPKTPDLREAVWRELEAMGQLSHPGLVQFRTAFGVSDGELAGAVCLAMELCERTLEAHLQAGRRLAVGEARGVARDLAEVLAWLHVQGVVHRDLKPANVFRARDRWKLGDLGLVRAVEGSLVSASGFKGSPQFMSPEALAGKVSTASDVWSLGALLQEALTGTPVYSGATVPELILASATQEPTIAPDLPSPFDAVVRGCLVKGPRSRWTAAQVLEALEGGALPAHAVPDGVRRTPRAKTKTTVPAVSTSTPSASTKAAAGARTVVRKTFHWADLDFLSLWPTFFFFCLWVMIAGMLVFVHPPDQPDSVFVTLSRRTTGEFVILVASFVLAVWQGLNLWVKLEAAWRVERDH
jgi:serine/threonine protein kinase